MSAAIEGSGMGGMKLPIGMTRRALSYDDNLEAPMSTPPHDISINNLWKRPLIPERRFTQLAEVRAIRSAVDSAPSRPPTLVKTKASSLIMNSLITKHTHDSMSKFEQRAGLSDTSYTPHKGLTAEETKLPHRMPEALQKLQIQSLEQREEKQNSSAQSTPSNTPHSSPRHQRRGWFQSTEATVEASVTSSSGSSVDMSAGDPAGALSSAGACLVHGRSFTSPPQTWDLWHRTGFALQAYRGAQKPSPMEVMKSQATRLADPTLQQVNPPKLEIPSVEGRRQGGRPHKLKHRDMNVLTPSGF
uniref:Putative monooxygenase p33MONOX n=1 Tax=Neogobius melanostomus TaxID=47308 RepID=A0A8C6SCX2_9GOBI